MNIINFQILLRTNNIFELITSEMAQSYYSHKIKENDARLQKLRHRDEHDQEQQRFLDHIEDEEINKKLSLKGQFFS